MSLSVSLIVRNSADVLERCLESVKDADEIVVVDTGSSDDTIEIAKKYTDKVYEYWGCNKGGKKDGLFMDFADARNKSLSYCTSTHILTIDADEVLESGMEELKKFEGESLSIRCINDYTSEVHRQPRLYVNHPNVFWKGAAHNYLTCGNGELSDITIRYYTNEQKKADPDRTKRILENWIKKNPKDCTREIYYLSKEYHKRGDFRKTIKLLKKYVNRSEFTIEKADAFVMMARCYAGLKRHKDAINCCLAAINLNPDFSEALRLAGDLNGDINRLKYQHLASKATDHGVLFIRPNNRIKVTILSEDDRGGLGQRIARTVRESSGGGIDIECISQNPGSPGPTVYNLGHDVANDRIFNSDIIHYNSDLPHPGIFYDMVIPYDKKIARLVTSTNYKEMPIHEFSADYNAYLTKDLHVDGWEFMPVPYTDFQYTWKRRKKFRVVYIFTGIEEAQLVADAITLLDRDDIEFVYKFNIPYREELKLKSTASLYIDKIALPPVGGSAYDALRFGVPVISWTDNTDDIALSPDKQTPESLAATINAVLNWDILEGLSLAAYKDVQERCGNMGEKWMNVYKSLITKS